MKCKHSPMNYVQHVEFSKVSELEISKAFRCYEREIPPPKSTGAEIDAVTWEETVNKLVEDLNKKGAHLSVRSCDELLKKCPPNLYGSSPNNKVQKDFSQMIQILEQLGFSNFDCTTSESTFKVLDKLYHLLDEWHDSNIESDADDSIEGTINYLMKKVLSALKDLTFLVTQEYTSSVVSKTRIHDALSRFIAELVHLVTYEKWRDEITARTNGNRYPMSFVMKKDELHSDVDDSDTDVIRKVNVTFSGKPDILCTRIQKLPSDSKTKYTIAPLVVEVKSTTRGFEKDPCQMTSASCAEAKSQKSGTETNRKSGNEMSPSTCNISDQVHDPRRRSNPDGIQANSRLEDLPHKHFLEMIACLKMFSPMVKVFGMYVVMNRVYFTCMVVCDECGKVPKHPQLIRDFIRINDAEDFKYSRENPFKLRYKQICSNWLNFFNPQHMKAILCFIRFILAEEQKYTDIYQFCQ